MLLHFIFYVSVAIYFYYKAGNYVNVKKI